MQTVKTKIYKQLFMTNTFHYCFKILSSRTMEWALTPNNPASNPILTINATCLTSVLLPKEKTGREPMVSDNKLNQFPLRTLAKYNDFFDKMDLVKMLKNLRK